MVCAQIRGCDGCLGDVWWLFTGALGFGCLCLGVVIGLLVCFDCGLVDVLCVNSVGIRYPEFIHICCLFACCSLMFVYGCDFFWMRAWVVLFGL